MLYQMGQEGRQPEEGPRCRQMGTSVSSMSYFSRQLACHAAFLAMSVWQSAAHMLIMHGLACRPDHRVMHADVRILMPVQSCVILMQLQAIVHWCRLVHDMPSCHPLHTYHARHTFAFPENGSCASADEMHLCIRQSCRT